MNYKDRIKKNFLKKGYFIFKIKKKNNLLKIRKYIQNLIKKKNIGSNLNKTHNFLDNKELNSLRMKVHSEMNLTNWFSKTYYQLASDEIREICGEDLVMQKKVNLSIQFPLDDSSILPLHSDVWTGCSPFEFVLWIPLVNVYKTKSMYILDAKVNEKIYKNYNKFKSIGEIEKKVLKNCKWLNLKFGYGLIFNQQLLHGNTINKTKETRWSLNCRFKSTFTPYAIKDIGETFIPISTTPLTELGLNYKDPNYEKKKFRS